MAVLKEAIVPALTVVFGVVYGISILGLPKESTVFPYFLMAVMPVLAALILWREIRHHRKTGRGEEQEPAGQLESRELGRPAIVFAASVAYLALFALTHFLVAAFLYMTFLMTALGTRPVRAAVISALFAATLYGVFGKLFLVDL